MKKIALSALLLLVPTAPALAVDCDCDPVGYQELMDMSVGQVQIKMEKYARLKEGYGHDGATYCYYTCSKEYERLRVAKMDKESELAQDLAARRALEVDTILQRRPLPR